MNKLILIGIAFILLPLIYSYDANWSTFGIYTNYTKPVEYVNMTLLVSYKYPVKLCFEVKLGDVIFDVQSKVKEIPLDKMMRWKNISWDSFDMVEIKYKLCPIHYNKSFYIYEEAIYYDFVKEDIIEGEIYGGLIKWKKEIASLVSV